MNYRKYLALICALFPLLHSNGQPTLEFSHERGFYKSSFQLTIKSNPPNTSIRFTLDGSDPRFATNAFSATSPAKITVDPYITTGRVVSPGVVVRACVIAGQDTSRTETQTYLFLNEVKYQREVSPVLLPYWPSEYYIPSSFSPNLVEWMQNLSRSQYIRLGIDRTVVIRDEYYSGFEQDLLSIPTLSLVTAPSSLFDDSTGIYSHGTWSGMDWERQASLELIDPSTEGFQVNTGIRIRGGWSSTGSNPKHAFRLYFRDQYGDSKLEFPLFENMGTDNFDKIDLRCEQNNSWNAANSNADYIHDAFSREIQGEMNQPYSRSRYYHLFLNGMYWGLYETQERPSASFAESYMGGKKEDYDVVKSSAGSIDYPPYTLEATDGNLTSSEALWNIAIKGFSQGNYMKVLGLNPDGSVNPAYPKYLDVDNLISYMMIIYYSANRDGPASLSPTDMRINNFFGIFNRENPDGFKYCIHDNETAYGSVTDNITNAPFVAGSTLESFNPMWLNRQLMENADYKQRFADLAYNYLYNNGVLSVDNNIARFQKRVELIDEAIVGESARWGGKYLSKLYAWLPVVNRMQQSFFPQRTQIVINQFKSMGWLNNLTPPSIDPNDIITGENQLMTRNGQIKLINSNSTGVIYFTTDNTDPRISEGGISPKAIVYTSAINVQKTIFLKARIKDGDQWSPLYETPVMKDEGSELLISEISYNPQQQITGIDTLKSNNLEFIEIKNISKSAIDLSGYTLSEGIHYEFPLDAQINGDSLIVLASDTSSFRRLYGFKPYGQFDGNLNNEKEMITLKNPCGAIISSIEYNSDGTWYNAADGAGYTLVPIGYVIDQLADMQPNWRVSTNWLGSPGQDDPPSIVQPVVFNEVLANSKKPQVDFIELTNTGNAPVNIGNWFLSDEKDTPNKWKIPQGTIIQPGGYISLLEGHYIGDSLHHSANEFGGSFSLSKGGETLYLYTNGNGGKTGSFVCEYAFGATDENCSFGKFISFSGNEHQVQLETPTPGAINGNARLSPLVFKTIMYHPVDGNFEYLVLKNRSDSIIHLYSVSNPDKTWKIKGVDFAFPAGISIMAGDSLFVVEKMISTEVFGLVMKLPSTAKIFTCKGKLNNSGETISIEKPLLVESDSIDNFNYITLEEIGYNDKKPWPTNADGEGYALSRINENAFGNDASNWRSVLQVVPVAIVGNNSRERLYSIVTLDGSGSFDPLQRPLTYDWKLESAPSGSSASLSDRHSVSPSFTCDKEGNYLFSLVVSNGFNSSAPAYLSIMGNQNIAPVTENTTRTYRIKLDQSLILGAFDCTDANYDSLSYTWVLIEKPAESTYELSEVNEKSFNFSADMTGNYRFSLTANDGEFSGGTVNIKVIVSEPNGIIAAKTGNAIRVYPNPIIDEAFVELNLNKESDATMQITALTGQVISRLELGNLNAGSHIIPVDFSNQQRGIYFISIRTNEFITNRKVYYMPGN